MLLWFSALRNDLKTGGPSILWIVQNGSPVLILLLLWQFWVCHKEWMFAGNIVSFWTVSPAFHAFLFFPSYVLSLSKELHLIAEKTNYGCLLLIFAFPSSSTKPARASISGILEAAATFAAFPSRSNSSYRTL